MVQRGSEWRNRYHKLAPDAGSPSRLDKLWHSIGEVVRILTRSSESQHLDHAGNCGIGKRYATTRERWARYGRTWNRFGWLTRKSGSVGSAEFGLKCP